MFNKPVYFKTYNLNYKCLKTVHKNMKILVWQDCVLFFKVKSTMIFITSGQNRNKFGKMFYVVSVHIMYQD